jgi:DNA-binding beta-propeller fold protein YncE
MKPAPPVTSTRSPLTRRRLWVGTTGVGAVAALVLAGALFGGCGGGSSSTTSPGSATEPAKPKRAAEPAESPPLTEPPAGRTAGVGNEPEGLAWDPKASLLAVGLREPNELAFVDPSSLAIAAQVPLPAAPRHLAYDPSSATVLVPAESADELVAARPAGVVYTVEVGTHPHDAAALDGEVFVADEHSDAVSVVRGSRAPVTLPAPHQPGGIAAVGGRFIALVAVSARVLQVYDARTLKPLGSTPAGVGPSHIVAAGDTAYVADTQGDRVLVFHIGAHPRLVATARAPGTPYGLAIDARRRRLWVTLTATNEIVEFSLAGPRPRRVATYATVRQPNSVAVEPGSGDVFVAGRAEGDIQRIEPGTGGSR